MIIIILLFFVSSFIISKKKSSGSSVQYKNGVSISNNSPENFHHHLSTKKYYQTKFEDTLEVKKRIYVSKNEKILNLQTNRLTVLNNNKSYDKNLELTIDSNRHFDFRKKLPYPSDHKTFKEP